VYFIEVNPRIQVEHTVTEMVTVSISCVRRFSSRQGHKLHERLWRCRIRRMFPLNGAALQCRVTTEDPENNFAPDYGKISTYRSPQALVSVSMAAPLMPARCSPPITIRFFVKVTAWGANFPKLGQAYGPRPPRIPHSRRENEYPLRRKCCEPPEVSRRRTHDLFPRRISRAFPFPQPRRPRH